MHCSGFRGVVMIRSMQWNAHSSGRVRGCLRQMSLWRHSASDKVTPILTACFPVMFISLKKKLLVCCCCFYRIQKDNFDVSHCILGGGGGVVCVDINFTISFHAWEQRFCVCVCLSDTVYLPWLFSQHGVSIYWPMVSLPVQSSTPLVVLSVLCILVMVTLPVSC